MAKYQGQRMVKEDEYAYLQELIESHEDPSAEWGGASYTAGTGIDITNEEISIDDTVVATKTDLEDYELKSDAFSGDYDDLTNKPDLSIYAQSANLATVATTGDYDDLLNKPSIPAAQVQSNWNESDTTSKAYIQNKPTIPAAVSGTNDGTNWTNLTIGQDTYAIPQGGGNVDIDNKTIIENQQGKLETAVGGWTESYTTEEYSFTLPMNSGEWNTDNSTIADTLYNLLQPSTRFDIEIKVYNGDTEVTPTYAITEAYIYSDIKENGWFNSNSRNDGITVKCSNNITYNWQFYIRPSTSKRVNIWQAQSVPGISTWSTTSISIKVKPTTISTVHKIKSQYLPDGLLTQSMLGDSLYINGSNQLNVKYESSYNSTKNPVKLGGGSNGLRAYLEYDNQTLTLTKTFPNDTSLTNLTTQIGGGYKNLFLLNKTKINTTSSLSDYGTTTQNEIVMFVKNAIINIIRSKQKPDTTSTRVLDLGFPSLKTSTQISGIWFKVNYALTENGGDTIQVTSSNNDLTADGFSFYYSTGEVITDNTTFYIKSQYITRILNADTSYFLFSDVIHAEDGQIIEQVDKKFIPLVSDIPAVPTTQGTYTLQVTVDQDGNPTFSWISQI